MEVSFAGKIICRWVFIAMIHYRTVAILVLECIGSIPFGVPTVCTFVFANTGNVLGNVSFAGFLVLAEFRKAPSSYGCTRLKNNNPYAQIVFWCCVRWSIVWMFRRLWRETMPSWWFFFGLGEPPILRIRVTHREDWPLGKYISNVGKTMS